MYIKRYICGIVNNNLLLNRTLGYKNNFVFSARLKTWAFCFSMLKQRWYRISCLACDAIFYSLLLQSHRVLCNRQTNPALCSLSAQWPLCLILAEAIRLVRAHSGKQTPEQWIMKPPWGTRQAGRTSGGM